MPLITHKGEVIFRRLNGYETPMDNFQRSAWVMFLYTVLSFYMLLIPLVADLPLQIIAALLHTANLAAMIYYWYVASATDPVDVTIFMALQATPRDIPSSELLFCQYCDCKVHRKSKHCRACNKCVGDFDHHCKWLNNCVGGANYVSFFRLINAAMLLTAIEGALGVHLVVQLWSDSTWLDTSPGAWWVRGIHRDAVIGLIMSVLVLALGASLMLLHLVGFHVYLQRAGISTYDYILGKRAKKRTSEAKKKEAGAPPATRRFSETSVKSVEAAGVAAKRPAAPPRALEPAGTTTDGIDLEAGTRRRAPMSAVERVGMGGSAAGSSGEQRANGRAQPWVDSSDGRERDVQSRSEKRAPSPDRVGGKASILKPLPPMVGGGGDRVRAWSEAGSAMEPPEVELTVESDGRSWPAAVGIPKLQLPGAVE